MNLWDYLFTEKSWINTNIKAAPDRVCAGDPVQGPVQSDGKIEVNAEYLRNHYNVDPADYRLLRVEGWSMFPEGIKDGDVLLCKKVSEVDSKSLQKSFFAITQVDKDFYASRRREPIYDHKLRKAIHKFNLSTDADAIIEMLSNDLKEDSILLEENQKLLKKKHKEAFEFYRNRQNVAGDNKEETDTDMMLSVTYHEGQLEYSFHPNRLIDYAVCYVYRLDGPEPLLLKKIGE